MKFIARLIALPFVLVVMLPAAALGMLWASIQFAFQNGEGKFWDAVYKVTAAEDSTRVGPD